MTRHQDCQTNHLLCERSEIANKNLNNYSKAAFETTGEQIIFTSVLARLTMTWALWVCTDAISTLLRNINYSPAVSVRKAAALYLPAFHSRHHLFVPSGRKFSGRNNDQIEAGLWRQESKNSSRWIEGIDNDSVFRQGSEINHRARGEGMEGKKKKKKKERKGKHFYRS